ncbi:MAG TPA: NADH-quinone oxidoreductase subunit G [Thiotrichales bacterium]|nr:NADH-quinone oxidoreductase subunit G [Thiotrichales bacterium]
MSDDSLVTIEIDGISLKAPKGAMVIEVADAKGIAIPRFCYHKKLSVAANCRMCLVEVENAPKPLPACATPVTDGMRVFTRSPKAIAAQKATMEFLLINHPLDCPICDQGGECELQDVALEYGGDVSRFSEGKRVVPDPDIGPLIATGMTRCIHCTRCVRFGEEIAGVKELGAAGRGEHTRIGTYMAHAVTSELSGNVIDICPVGALTARPSRYSARAWELLQAPSVAVHDCVGSNLSVHLYQKRVNRVVPRENEAVNECWISDRDRFSYKGLERDRLSVPMVKEAGEWREVAWEEALERAASLLKANAGDGLGLLASPSATLEELFLLNRIGNGLGSANIDHRLRQGDFRLDAEGVALGGLGTPLAELSRAGAALVIGGNPRKEQPMLGHRLRKAALAGGKISYLNGREFPLNYRPHAVITAAPGRWVEELAAIAAALFNLAGGEPPAHLSPLLEGVEIGDDHRRIAESLVEAERPPVLLGVQAVAHPDFSWLASLASAIAGASGGRHGVITEGGNGAGAWLAGVVPHLDAGGGRRSRPGLDARGMLEQPRSAYLLQGVEPSADCWDPLVAGGALEGATVVALTSFDTPELRALADVMLPVAAWSETSGTYVNAEGRWQRVRALAEAPGDARPGWKVLRVLGNLLDLEEFDYQSSEEVADTLRALMEEVGSANDTVPSLPGMRRLKGEGMVRLAAAAPYRVDGLVRRSRPLQETVDGRDLALRIHPDDATSLGLAEAELVLVRQGEAVVSVPLVLDEGVARGCGWLPAASEWSGRLGGMIAPMEISAD